MELQDDAAHVFLGEEILSGEVEVIHGAQRIEEERIAAPACEEAVVASVRNPRLSIQRDWRTRDDNLAVIADSGGLRTFDVAQRCGLRSIRERRELNSVRNIGDCIAVCVDLELVFAPPELAEFIKYLLAALKSAGIRDPADVLAYGVRREAEAAAAKLGSSAAIGDVAAEQKSDGHSPVTIENNSSTISDASTPRPVAQIIAYVTTKAEDERQSDKPATNIVPRTIANPQASTPATAAAGDEIVIHDRHLLGERRVAKMLGCSLRTLQRSRTKGKGPASTKIGRKVFYELNDLQEWIDRGKIR